ncbi:MAG: hypothetical protein DKT66_25065 [Candidatus Melainabacteria bacterium]|nr:MAG: hypothetical protein DKT66_25065 [Candidatus Melainabacteria bacterium]
MRRAKVFAMAALFLALQPGLLTASPAYGNDLSNLLGNLSGLGNFTDIDTRQVQIEKRIKDAISSGRLTWAEGDVYLKQLAQIERAEADYRVSDNKLSTWESMRLSLDLDKLSRDLETHMRDRSSGSVDIDSMQADILKRMTDGLSARRLTRQEYDDLKYDFDRSASLEALYRQSDNKLDYDETMKLALDLDRLSTRLERTLHDRDVSIGDADARQAELDKKIQDGLASGKLTTGEASQLRAEFNRISEREAALKSSGRPISPEDRLALLIDLERLNTQIELKLANSETASTAGAQVNVRRAQIESLISDSLVQGKLTPLEAQQFKTQLDRLQTLARDMAQSDGLLTPVEAQTISVEYSMLESRVNRTMVGRAGVWPGITGRVGEIEQRINDSASSRRLTDAEATGLRAELQRIKEMAASTRKTDGTFALDSSLAVASDLERLSHKVNQSLHDRTEITIDLDQKQREIDKQIADGVLAGTLTLPEARELDAEGDRIERKEAEFRTSQSGLNYRERLALAYDLEQLATKVDQQIRDSEREPIDLQAQKALIDKLVTAATINGRLTSDEARSIKAERDRLTALEFQCRASDGRLTAGESILIASEWDKLQRAVKKQAQDKERDVSDIDARQARIQRRISEGLSSGRITAREAERLGKEFDVIASKEAQFRADGGLSYGESLTLAIELEQLTRKVENAIANGRINLPDVDSKQREIDVELAAAVASGRLALRDAQNFRVEIDRIAAEEAGYRQSGGGISVSETQMLLTELDKLQATVDARLKDSKPVWSGLAGRRNELSTQLTQLEQAKKLKPEDLFKFKAELNRISQAESAFQASGGAIDLAETVSLVNDLDLLKRRIDSRIGVISVNLAWDDIDGRQADLDRRINKALMRRMISPAEAQKLKVESSKIHQAEATFKANDGSLSYFEKMALAGQLDKLNRLVPTE